ncbi:MAG: bifunctional 5-dehydro-2-deoxygluconokinase/5-dehydro-2-deoxyphosphogluconate aldolase [Pseudomonadota bacterium]
MAADRRLDFIAIGRAAVDLYGEQVGGRLEDMSSFAKYLGGCPANIAVGAARLGLKPAMLTRVGDEHMGRFVRETLAAEGVDVSHVKTDPRRLTGLVILGIRDRETFPLIFYRENCADMGITEADIDPGFIAQAQALLVTGTHFSQQPVDAACRLAMRHAKAAGTRVALDIDYRPVLWGLTGHGLGEARFVASEAVSAHLQTIVPDCDLVVGTEEEIHIAGGATETLAALRALRELTAATLVVKRGARGCVVFAGAIPTFIEDGIVGQGFPVEVYNVLGAGDGFMAGLIAGWLRGESWERAARLANACGALVVSRHGCAPAMPSRAELDDFLARADRLTRLHEDARIATLHRLTTRRRAWPQVLALAFDHRRQLEDLARRHRAPSARIARFKELVAAAAREAGAGVEGRGAIIDDRFGRDPLYALTGTGWWLARPVERPGATPLAFEAGPDVALTLRTWPAEHVAKCLVRTRPDDPPPLQAAQEAQVAALFRACVATGHELLLEVIPPGAGNSEVLAGAIERFYELGIQPEWWKLPPPADGWGRVGDVVRAHDPHCRGILILGAEAGEGDLARAFTAARGEDLVRGFAVGRAIFWKPAEDWFAGEADDRAATAAIARNYARVIALWRTRATAAG